ncbi:hypothetical protein LNJ05_12205, partial [Tenacibaculum finnmarkense genomovar ulcerans]|nr:hypothetical protein [Tenacibaculum finnmarkense genomovar ulcerans]
HYGFLSSSWKREKLPQIQLQLLDRDKEVLGVYIDSEKSLLNVCPSCKKGTLITLLTFDGRGPPENYKNRLKNNSEVYRIFKKHKNSYRITPYPEYRISQQCI